ncbi:DMT family transporter [bacterium]|nr:DMT family transporter [bacterium]
MINKTVKAHLALLGANLIYGVNYSIAKLVMPEFIEPFGFIFCRVLGALLLFWGLTVFMKGEKIERKDYWRLFICGAFGVAGNQLSFFYGLNITSPINAAIIMTCNPVLVLIMSSIILKERINGLKLGGIFMGLTGAVGLILFNKSLTISTDTIIGDLFIFINATSYAIYLVMVKPLMKKYEPLTVIKWVFLFGFLFVFPFGFNQFKAIEWSTFTTNTWLAFSFVVVATTFFAYLFNIYALKSVNPSVVSIYIYSQPIVATMVTLFIGQDELNFLKLFSALLIFVGVYLVSHKPKMKSA